MTPWLIALAVVVLLTVGVTLFLVFKPAPNVGDRSKLQISRTAEDQRKIDTVTITPAQLADATCDAGKKCWIAVDGVVYDMSVFPKWARGEHHGVKAGTDATEKFVGSGHAAAYLQKMPVVGRLG